MAQTVALEREYVSNRIVFVKPAPKERQRSQRKKSQRLEGLRVLEINEAT